MSSQMKKTLRAAGAVGLTAATIVTGLGLGHAAATAAQDDSSNETRGLASPAGARTPAEREVRALEATATFSSNVETVVQLSGTGQPNTTVNFWSGSNKLPFTAQTDEKGDWEAPLNPPNRPGVYRLTVSQTIGGDEHDSEIELPVDYGKGVEVTSDETPTLGPDGSVTIDGTAPDGTVVQAREVGSDRVLESATAGPSDTFTLRLDGLEDREHHLVVEGITKGYNRTSDDVTVKPEQGGLVPATVTTKDFTAGTANTFTGTATLGATVRILDADDHDILGRELPVDADGGWEFTKSFPSDATEFAFKVRQSRGTDTLTSDLFTLRSDIADFSPVTLATKTVIPGLENTVTGHATPGASLRILNASGTQIVTGTITADSATGAFSFTRVVSKGASKLEFAIEQTKDGKKLTSPLFSLAADTAAAPAPVVVDNTIVEAGVENTFTGKGPAGAVYRVLNVSNTQIVPGTFAISKDGDWTFTRVVSSTASKFDFKLEITLPSGQQYRTSVFSLAATVFRPVTVDQTSVTPGVPNRFTGNGTPGATFRVLNVSGTQIVPGTFTMTGSGRWQFDRVVSSTAKNFRFKLEVTKNGQTETSELFDLPAE
ncbi:hypothetical protein [Curtobacterium sp. P97]|uniref:hypothetical protein n=2 Tax=unclassified Curtobacterium TaxID=257496 RepID=UPI00203D4861|nr:hypothetical protein [Curtobacterium sp. P97]